MGPTWHAEWAAALDALEMEVEAVEAMLVDEHRSRETAAADPWTPPAGLGPLPLDLRPRADGILARQLAAAQQITLALATNRRQAAFAAKVEVGAQGAARPAYLDCAM